MKVKVRYMAVKEAEIEVDDKFDILRTSHPDYEALGWDKEFEMHDELIDEAMRQIDDFYSVDDLRDIDAMNGEALVEN